MPDHDVASRQRRRPRRHGGARGPHDHRPRPADLVAAVVATAVLVGVWWLLGEAIVHSPSIVDADASISRWFADHRAPAVDAISFVGSQLGDTVVKLVVTAVAAGRAIWRFRRWLEPTMIAAPLAIEATTFITVTHLVGRARPDVVALESSFVHSSFPSGHVAAAAVYAGIAVVVGWHARSHAVRARAFALVATITLAVALARVSRGMHHATDVVAGAVLGAVAVALVAHRLRPRVAAAERAAACGAAAVAPDGQEVAESSIPRYPSAATAASRLR